MSYPYDPDADESMYFTHTDSLLTAMTEALGNQSEKVRERIIKALVKLAAGSENIGLSTLFWQATKTEPASLSAPAASARLKLMQALIKEKGEKDKASIGKRVIDFAVSASRNAETRAEALELLSDCRAAIKDKLAELLKGLPEDEKLQDPQSHLPLRPGFLKFLRPKKKTWKKQGWRSKKLGKRDAGSSAANSVAEQSRNLRRTPSIFTCTENVRCY